MAPKGMPVRIVGPVRAVGRTVQTPMTAVPGIVAAAAYAAGDALGRKFVVDDVPEMGIIRGVLAVDLDKEDITFDAFLFANDFDGGTDNDAFDMTDDDGDRFIGAIQVSTFFDMNDNSVAVEDGLELFYVAPKERFYVQLVTRGAPNFTAATDMRIAFVIEEVRPVEGAAVGGEAQS